MNAVTPTEGKSLPVFDGDVKMLRLAREIAMDIHPLDEILKRCSIDAQEWGILRVSPRFTGILKAQVEAWQSANNTAERVKLKSLAFVEESLPEFFGRAHDSREVLSSKVELLKTVAKFAGIGGNEGNISNLGSQFSITINMGAESVKVTPQLPTGVTLDAAEFNSELG